MALTKLWSRNEEGGIQRHKTIIEEGDQSFLEAWKVCLGASLDTSRAATIPCLSLSVTTVKLLPVVGKYKFSSSCN